MMCMSADRAEFSGTRIYVGDAVVEGRYVHVLAYQNVAKNLSDKPNAMILPFPASKPMVEQNVIDTTEFKGFLKDISEATVIRRRSRSFGEDFYGATLSAKALVFDSGSYTVVLANKTDQIPEALNKVPINKRPTLTDNFLADFGQLYPEHQVAVCCWDGSVEAEPILWWYEPINADTYFVPTMDAHDGNAPDIKAVVNTDHIISVSHPSGKQVNYTHDTEKMPTRARNLLPTHVHGVKLHRPMRNGDMTIKVSDIKSKYDGRSGPMIVRTNAKQPDVVSIEMAGWTD